MYVYVVRLDKKKDKDEKETYVFEIKLTEYTNENHAEYNWKDLVQEEEDRKRDSDIEIIEVEGTSLVKKAVGIFKCSR